eukprot:g798.t1
MRVVLVAMLMMAVLGVRSAAATEAVKAEFVAGGSSASAFSLSAMAHQAAKERLPGLARDDDGDERQKAPLVCAISCGGESDHGQDVEISFVPDTCVVKSGEEAELTLKYNLDEEVTGGEQHLVIMFNGLKVSDKTVKLDTLENVTLPLKVGPQSSDTKILVPDNIPSGTLLATQTWTDQNGEQIICLKYQMKH